MSDLMLGQIADVVRRAGEIVRSASADKQVREKSGHQDLVTRYDSMTQAFLERELLALMPQAGFLGEEDLGHDAHSEREWVFVVDPIDGTTNFIKGFPHCGISVGLTRRGTMELGVVYDPYRDELFTARRGGGARCNGEELQVSGLPVEDCVIDMGTSPYYRQYQDVTFAMGKTLFSQCLDVRRMAAASLDLCYVAAGRVDGYFECLLSPWDYAAGSLILQEAGGLATDLHGEPLRFDRKCSLAAGTPACHRALLEAAEKHGFRESM